MRLSLLPLHAALVLASVFATRSASAAPPPLDPVTFSFPGSFPAPASGVSAGLALADRWLAPGAFDNPAVVGPKGLQVSPALLRVNRQDLRAANRETDEQTAFVDLAGVSLSFPGSQFGLTLWVHQPTLRLENTAFTKGASIVIGPPAMISTDAEMREMRGGLAVSFGTQTLRVGLSGEWTHRDDFYAITETSGDPGAGTRALEFSGDVVGGSAGVRFERAPETRGGLVLGFSGRVTPSLEVSGVSTSELVAGDTSFAVSAKRSVLFEGGATARVTITPEAAFFLSAGGRSEEKWDGFELEAGAGTEWHAGLEYRDVEIPWSARMGFGQEIQPGTPEPRATAFGLGLGWTDASLSVDVGYLRRSLARPGRATAYDHRVVASLGVRF